MLEQLDTFIAFAAVMLGASLFVTILTQIIPTLLNLRGWNLRNGLATLFETLEPQLKGVAKALASKILMDPLVEGGMVKPRLAPVLRRDELLLYLADPRFDGAVREALAEALKTLRKPEARALLTRLLGATAAAAVTDPSAALAQAAAAVKARITARVEAIDQWFEFAMDRVSQKFAGRMRVFTIVFSAILALAIHLDTFDLLQRFSQNATLRAQAVASATVLTKQATDILADNPSNGSVDQLKAQVAGLQKTMQDTELRLIPEPYPGPFAYHLGDRHFWGVLASAALLSLGAPFWFNALKTMSSLRPIVASKEEQERQGG